MKNNTFLKNTFHLYLMNITKVFFPFISLIFLTRNLSKDAYGLVTYVKSIIVYVQLIIDFGFLLSSTKRIVLAKTSNEVGEIVGDTIIEKLLLAIVSLVLYIGSMIYIPIMRTNVIFSLFYFLSAVSNVFILDFLFRGLEKMQYVAIPYVVSKTLITFCTILFVKSDQCILMIPTFELVGNLIAIIISYYYFKSLNIKLSITNLKNMIEDIKESGIYFISNFATTVFGAFTTVISGFYLDVSSIAVWGICMQIVNAAKAFYNPISNSLYPKMISEKNIMLVKKINIVMGFPMILGTIVVLLFSNRIMLIIGGDKYLTGGTVLKFLLPAIVFSFYSMIYGWPVLGAIGKIKQTTATTVLVSIFQLLFILVIIIFNRFSMISLAISCSLSEFLLFLFRYLIYVHFRNNFNQ